MTTSPRFPIGATITRIGQGYNGTVIEYDINDVLIVEWHKWHNESFRSPEFITRDLYEVNPAAENPVGKPLLIHSHVRQVVPKTERNYRFWNLIGYMKNRIEKDENKMATAPSTFTPLPLQTMPYEQAKTIGTKHLLGLSVLQNHGCEVFGKYEFPDEFGYYDMPNNIKLNWHYEYWTMPEKRAFELMDVNGYYYNGHFWTNPAIDEILTSAALEALEMEDTQPIETAKEELNEQYGKFVETDISLIDRFKKRDLAEFGYVRFRDDFWTWDINDGETLCVSCFTIYAYGYNQCPVCGHEKQHIFTKPQLAPQPSALLYLPSIRRVLKVDWLWCSKHPSSALKIGEILYEDHSQFTAYHASTTKGYGIQWQSHIFSNEKGFWGVFLPHEIKRMRIEEANI